MKILTLGFGIVGLAVIAACAPPAPGLSGPGGSSSNGSPANGDDDDDDNAPKAPAAKPSSPSTPPPAAHPSTPPAAPSDSSSSKTAPPTTPAAPFSITATSGHRMGDNDAVSNSGTSVEQLQSLLFVHAQTHDVALTASGGALDAIKNDIGGDGQLKVTLPGTAKPGLYALVDGALYTPNANLALTPGMDLEHFPKGVVGYVNVTYDTTWYASWSSDIIWSGWELGELALGHADRLKSPLVVDLGGVGVFFEPPRSVFDVDGDGRRDRIAWVASTDTPFLVRDRNRNGKIDGIDEMFGDSTLDRTGSGRTSKNGFEALAQYDFDGNGAIDRRDPVYRELGLWFDRNHDGVTDPGEIETLSARHITQISLGYTAVDVRASFGNRILQQGEVATTGGTVAIYDVWFRLDRPRGE